MSDLPVTPERCRAVRRDGSPCKGRAIADGLCFAHGATANAETRRKGGQRSSKAARSLKALPERLRPAADMLAEAMEATRSGEMEPKVATALAALAGALVRVVSSGELEERVRQLEAVASGAEASA